MNRFYSLISVTVCCLFPVVLVANEIEDLVIESKSLIQSYSSQLQSAYDNAYGSGISDAIQGVCRKTAVDIANKLAKDGWIIERTGLSVLNKNNAPDYTELKVLQNFIARLSEEKDTETLSWYKFNEAGNQSEFRYIKMFTMAQRCMTCHKRQESKTESPPALSAYTLTRFEIRNYFPEQVQPGQHETLPTFGE